MQLSKKNIKYIRRNIHSKSLESISQDVGISLDELKAYLKTDGQVVPNFKNTSQLDTQKFDIGQKLFVIFMGILLMCAPLFCKGIEWFDFANLPQSLYIQGISLLFLFLFFARGLLTQKMEIVWSWFYVPIFGLLIWGALSMLWSTNIYEHLSVYLNWLAGGIIFFVLINTIRDDIDIKIIGGFLFIALIRLVYIGFRQYLDNNYSVYPQVIVPSGTFGNKNMFVDVLISIVPIALYLTFIKGKKFLALNIIGAILYSLTVILILLSLTRAGISGTLIQAFAFVVSLFIIGHFRKETGIFSNSFVIVQLSILILLPIIFFGTLEIKNANIENEKIDKTLSFKNVTDRFYSIFEPNKQDNWVFKKDTKDEDLQPISDSANMRKVVWANTFAMFLKNPFGVGVYNWQIHYADYRRAVYNDPVYRPGTQMIRVHNDYLQLLAELGIPGALFGLGLLLLNLWAILRCLLRGTKDNLVIALLLGLSLLGLHFVAVFSFPFSKAIPTLLFFVYTAFLAYYFNLNAKDKKDKKILIKQSWNLGFTLTALLLLVIAVPKLRDMGLADIEFKRSFDQNSVGNFENAVDAAEKALILDPYRNKLYFLLGFNYLSLGDFENAEKQLELGLKYYPNDLNSLLQLGTTYTQLITQELKANGSETKKAKEMIEKAEKWFNKAISIRNDFHTIYNNWGYIYSVRADCAQKSDPELYKLFSDIAFEKFSKSIELEPNYVDGLLNRSTLLLKKGQAKEAIIHAEKAAGILTAEFDRTDQEFIKVSKVIKPNSNKYSKALNDRLKARQVFLGSITKAIDFMLNYYSNHEKNCEKIIGVYDLQLKYLYAREIELMEKLSISQNEYSKSQYLFNLKKIRQEDLDIYKNTYERRKKDFDAFKKELPFTNLLLRFNKAEQYMLYKLDDMAQPHLNWVLNQIQTLDKTTFDANKQNSINYIQDKALLCKAEVLLRKSGVNTNGGLVLNKENLETFNKNSAEIANLLNQAKNSNEAGLQPFKAQMLKNLAVAKERFSTIKFNNNDHK